MVRGSPFAAAALGAALLVTATARAQQESAAAAMPGPAPQHAPGYAVEVRGSPSWTQTRSFAATRFWVLDPGEQEVEAWYSTRIHHNGDPSSTEHLWQLEYMAGVAPRVQLDVYFNYAHDDGGFHVEGAQIEGRFALARRYGEIWGNPALYLEWHPIHGGPDRGEARVLIGGEILTPRLHGAFNPFFEQNLNTANGEPFSADREIGAALALGYAFVPGVLSLGGELKVAADQQDETDYKGVAKVGPTVWLSTASNHLRFTATALVGLTKKSDAFNPMLIVGLHP